MQPLPTTPDHQGRLNGIEENIYEFDILPLISPLELLVSFAASFFLNPILEPCLPELAWVSMIFSDTQRGGTFASLSDFLPPGC